VGVLFEGAFTAIQKRDKSNAELQQTGARGKTTMDRDWPGDWKLAEDGFRRYERSSVRADWFHDSVGPIENWSVTGDSVVRVRDCEALCIQAGRLLTVSPMFSQISTELQALRNDGERWLYYLKCRYGIQDNLHGQSTHDGKVFPCWGGTIRSLAATSARA